MILVIFSLLTIMGYTTAVCIKTKGIPYSISATYYALEHKLVFGACVTLTAMFLFPVVWELSATFIMRLLAITACVGLIGVGLAPDFRDSWVNKIHCVSAALTLISSQLWVACTSYCWLLVLLWGLFVSYTLWWILRHREAELKTRFISSKPMFWCEITALFVTDLTAILLNL